MRCGRIIVDGDAEEIALWQKPKSRQKREKRQNPYSTRGLDKFESVRSELSSRRQYIAKKTGVPEAMIRFVDSKNGWIPFVVGARDEMGKKNSGEVAGRVSILGHVKKSNEVNHGHKQPHDSKARAVRRVASVDNKHSIGPARHVQGFDSFYRRTSPVMGYNAYVGATVMILVMFCLLFYGPLYAILLWLYLPQWSRRLRKNERNE